MTWYSLDPRSVFKWGSYSQLLVEAGLKALFDEPVKEAVSKALPKVCQMDSRRWIVFLTGLLENFNTLKYELLSEEERLMLSMFHATVWDTAIEVYDQNVHEHFNQLANSPNMLNDLIDLLKWNYNHIDFIDQSSGLPYACPLDVYCTYSQRQLLAGLGYCNFGAMRQGVLYLKDKKTDIFLITLNKSDKDYSPTTMYNDYAVNTELFHWQSQSTTSENSQTGQRYIHHAETDNHILLFVREFKQDQWGTSSYTYLGEAEYKNHNGSRPMNILWKLKCAIPAKYIRKLQQVLG